MARFEHVKTAFAAGLLFGGVSGLGEVGWLGLRRAAAGELVFVAEFFWLLAPLVNGLLIAVISALVVAALPPAAGRSVRFAVPGVLAVFALLLVPGRLHLLAVVLVAVGAGWRLGSWLNASGVWTGRRVAIATPVVLLLVPLGAWLLLRATSDTGRPASDAPRDAPNVLLIVLDTVRAMELSLYQPGLGTTPGIDSLASGGVVFERANSTAPWTLPSHASMFTGRWAHELEADYDRPMGGEHETLASLLSWAGYETAGFTANHEYTTRETGVAKGFRHYEDRVFSAVELTRLTAATRFIFDRLARIRGTADRIPNRIAAEDITRRALAWFDEGEKSPFFVFLNYYEAHAPYDAPDSVWRRFLPDGPAPPLDIAPRDSWGVEAVSSRLGGYRASIAHLDHELQRLFRELDGRGLLRNTVVVLTSDHGEEFSEHDVMGHGNSLHHAGVHVPLVVQWPGEIPRGIRIESPVSLRDLPATLLDLIGLEPGSLPGRSLRRFWGEAPRPTPDLIYTQVTRSRNLPARYPVMRSTLAAAQRGPFRLIVEDREGGELSLFDHSEDPGEQHDLLAVPTGREEAARLLEALTRSRALADPSWGARPGGGN